MDQMNGPMDQMNGPMDQLQSNEVSYVTSRDDTVLPPSRPRATPPSTYTEPTHVKPSNSTSPVAPPPGARATHSYTSSPRYATTKTASPKLCAASHSAPSL